MQPTLKQKLTATLTSRKFWGAVLASAGMAATAVSNGDHVTVDLVMKVLSPLLGYLTLEGLRDAAAALPAPVVPATSAAQSAAAEANAALGAIGGWHPVRRLALVALLALASCASVTSDEVATFAGAALGAAAGSLTAAVATPSPAPVAVPVVAGRADGGAVVDWPDAGGPCSAVADRVCCTPEAISRLVRRDGGP
jgi:hypothetical protein